MSQAQTLVVNLDEVYGAHYYTTGCGKPYQQWLEFFDGIAERIVRDLNPASVLDASCALGYLVEGLRKRGIDAEWIDLSDYAIQNVHPGIKDHCRVQSVTTPLLRHYDLIVCIEVLEHLVAAEAEQAVINFCRSSDRVLFSSTPFDYNEATHLNVRPPEYWAELFERQGFYRDVEVDTSFITSRCALFCKRVSSFPRVASNYERRHWQLLQETQSIRQTALPQRGQFEHFTRENSAKEMALQSIKQESETRWKLLMEAQAREAGYLRRIAELNQQAHAILSTLAGGRGAEMLSLRPEARELITNSFTWAIALRLSALRSRLAPEASRRDRWLRLCMRGLRLWRREGLKVLSRRTAGKLKRRLNALPFLSRRGQEPLPLSDYERLFAAQQLTPAELAAQRHTASTLPYRPLISILTPTYNTPKDILRATLATVQAQTYDNWELCIADGGSSDPALRRILEKAATTDPRICVRFLSANRGISHNSNACLEMAKGEFVALLDHDDLLAPSALFEMVQRLNEDPQLDFLYSDKDLITENGSRHFNPLFKPAWSPDIMLMANYLTHFNILRTERVCAVGGFRPEADGAQDWDLFLRVLEGTTRIAHIPKVLYHWRYWPQSTSAGINAKPYASAAQLRVINEHCRRTGRKGEVVTDRSGYWHLRRNDPDAKRITVIVRTDGTSGRLPGLLRKLQQQQDRDHLSLVVAHVGTLPSPLHDYYESLTCDHQVRVVVQGKGESIPALLNRAAQGQETDLLLFLTDWLDPVEGWLDELVVCAEQPGVAIIGGKITNRSDTLLQGALVLRRDGQVLPLYAGLTGSEWGSFGDSRWYRNCSAVSGACLMIHRDAFVQAGGFDPDYQRSGHDVDLCCRVRAQGQRILYNPFAAFVAPTAEGRFVPLGTADQQRLRTACQSLLSECDPYFNANLAEDSPRPRLRSNTERPCLQEGDASLFDSAVQAEAGNDIRWVRPDESMQTALAFATLFDFSPAHREASLHLQAANAGALNIRSVNWFLPGFTNAGYGGIHTILRLANHLRFRHGIVNRFYYLGSQPAEALRASIVQCFPGLADQIVRPVAGDADLERLEYADACVATLWTTAYAVLKFQRTRRKFYMLQDYEPLFYPAGSTSAQVEASYRFGFYGLANTRPLKDIYEREYGGLACSFTPAVETALFYPGVRPSSAPGRIFFYGRPNNPRNAFELGTEALRRVKERLGERVQILSAGEDWRPADFGLESVIENKGVLSIRQTAELYRTCDLGLVFMFTRHPSYLPLEFMASGCLVITNRNPATTWLLRDHENCLLTEPSVESIATTVEQALCDKPLSERITRSARAEIEEKYAAWNTQLEKVFAFMCDPHEVVAAPIVAPSIAQVAA